MTKKINLALQGGGAHGAYTWGVLDCLLQEERLEIEGVSGTSAGAMNAAMLVNGYAKNGREGARAALRELWTAVSEISAFGPLHQTPLEHWLDGWNLDWSPAYHYFDLLSRIASPYDLNPLNVNPLRFVLDNLMDFKSLQAHSKIKLFVAATHVASGQARVFKCHEITTDVLLASACLPFLFQAVEIEGEHYWDGGYMGNPAIWPLIYNCDSEDVVLVQINPLHRDGVPKTANEIINRLNEISFNSSLIAEMRAIDFVGRLIHQGRLSKDDYKDMKIHLIYSPEEVKTLNASSKMNASWDFFEYMHGAGFKAAKEWIKENFDAIGQRSTVNIRNKFLRGPHIAPDYCDLGHKKHQQQAEQQQKSGKPE